MLMKIEHTTEMNYSGLINETVMEMRMAPRQERWQHRLSFDLAIGPAASVRNYFDWLGNTVHAFAVTGLHRNIKIVATSVVLTSNRGRSPGDLPDSWPLPVQSDYALSDFLRLEGPVMDCPALDQLAARIRPKGTVPLAKVILEIMDTINSEFQYEKGVTTASSPITEVLEHRRGVCQDFTHLMIALVRKLNVPVRYVSGYIHAGHHAYRGVAQTHAWCEVYFPSVGWVGFDPTNNCLTGDNFVKMAVGRHYRDVPPHKGVYRGSAKETMDVKVHTEELPELSPRFVGERVTMLDVPIFRPSSRGQIVPWILDEQVEQQQQQQ